MNAQLTAILLVVFSSSLFAAESNRLSVFKKDIKPLFEKHCNRCHGGEKTKGDIDLTIFTSDRKILENSADLILMKEALINKDMPPKPKKTGYSDDHQKILIDWVTNYIEKVDYSDPVYKDPGPAVARQLTSDEYNRTIKSLVGISINVNKEIGIKKESNPHAFSNHAASMQMSSLLIEKYFDAADLVIEKLIDSKESSKAKEMLFRGIEGETNSSALKFLNRFLVKAYRRKVGAGEVKRLFPLYSLMRSKGKSFQEALIHTIKPILVSPYFLNKIEANRAPRKSKKVYLVSNMELAVRMSYFLWSTMPDDELLNIAAQGKLRSAEEITKQVTRLLKDEKAKALTENFMAEWLEFEDVRRALPGTRNFPSFNNEMKNAMRDETKMFIETVIKEDLSVINFIDSEFTFLNEKLARHYGIPGSFDKKMKRVELKPEYKRGGLLGMGSILAMTSHTNRTKPTARGKWVAEVMLGTKIPEPPANVEAIAKDKSGKEARTFREKLNQHVADATCAVCHKKMDPLGFAMENYNAIGQWRKDFAGSPIDNTGVLPDGTKVSGVSDLKKVILQRKDLFVKNMFTKMLSYAIGRKLEYYDQLTVKKAVENIKKADYKFSAMVMEVVKSRPFLFRKNIENYYSTQK